MEEKHLKDVVNFVTSYDKKKANIFYRALRYFDYKRLRSNYTFKDLPNRPTFDIIREFISNYELLDRLLRLSENKKYNFISINRQLQHHQSENVIMDYKYEITILKVKTPDKKYTVSWDSVLKEVEIDIDDNQYYTIVGDSNDYCTYILDIALYVFDTILDNFWNIDIRDLNKSPISITKLSLSMMKIEIEHTKKREYFSIDSNSIGSVQFDDRRSAMIFLVRGCVALYDDIYYNYECNLVVEYLEYYKDHIQVTRLYLLDQLELKRTEIRQNLESIVSYSSYWDHILGTI